MSCIPVISSLQAIASIMEQLIFPLKKNRLMYILKIPISGLNFIFNFFLDAILSVD